MNCGVNRNAIISECSGTFALVFLAAGASANVEFIGNVGVALAQGLALLALVVSYQGSSGAHFNPAISLSMWIMSRLSTRGLGAYWAAQLAGAVMASWVVRLLFGDPLSARSLLVIADEVSSLRGVLIEAVLTYFFVKTFARITKSSSPELLPFAVGGIAVANALVAGSLTGAAFNPVRALGPALSFGIFTDWWIYCLGPILGALLASLTSLSEPKRSTCCKEQLNFEQELA